jgi:hypothetical protein
MQSPQPSKQFRWIGQPSEEELLGIPVVSKPHQERTAVRAAPLPATRRAALAPSPARRFRVRDVATVLGLVVVMWLVLGGAGAGFRFPGSEAAPLEAHDPDPGFVVLDRNELASLPRAVPSAPGRERGGDGGSKADDRGSKPGGDDSNPPGGGGGGGGGGDPADPPLVQATLPIVGTVTVEDPGLDEALSPLPEVPETDDVLPGTSTLPLP